jgi:hypothetical protein
MLRRKGRNSRRGAMEAIAGNITAVDQRAKTITVTTVTKRGRRETTTDFEVPWSRNTAFVSKGKRKLTSRAERLRLGMDVIVQFPGPGLPADVVWHPPGGGVIGLTIRECRDLGGEIETDGSCPELGSVPSNQSIRRRCRIKATGGSTCITDLG